MRRHSHFGRKLAILLLTLAGVVAVQGFQRQSEGASDSASGGLGPEMNEYMTFLDAELAELTHLHENGEVALADFRLSRDRLDATREAAVRIARTRHEDRVPDLYVLVDRELTQILPTGAVALRGKKSGDRVGEDFVFHGRVRRNSWFNVLERTGGIKRATPY